MWGRLFSLSSCLHHVGTPPSIACRDFEVCSDVKRKTLQKMSIKLLRQVWSWRIGRTFQSCKQDVVNKTNLTNLTFVSSSRRSAPLAASSRACCSFRRASAASWRSWIFSANDATCEKSDWAYGTYIVGAAKLTIRQEEKDQRFSNAISCFAGLHDDVLLVPLKCVPMQRLRLEARSRFENELLMLPSAIVFAQARPTGGACQQERFCLEDCWFAQSRVPYRPSKYLICWLDNIFWACFWGWRPSACTADSLIYVGHWDWH